MNDGELMVMIWLMIGMGLWIVRLKWVNRKLNRQLAAQALAAAAPALPLPAAATPATRPERDAEMERLRERVAVLERITVDKENSLAREIDGLRHGR